MKRILCFLLILSFLFLLSSCGRIEEGEEGREDVKEEISFGMEKLKTASVGGVHIIYYRDVATDVMYLSSGYQGGLTVMMDPETGLPLTYARYIEVYQGK